MTKPENAGSGDRKKPVRVNLASAILRAEHEGEIPISDPPLACAVLEGEIRILSGRGISTSLGRHATGGRSGSETGDEFPGNGVVKLPPFLSAKNLKPFIDNDLMASSTSPIEYLPKHGGRTAYGYKAELLPKICEVWLKARDAGVLTPSQKQTAVRADILMRGLAHAGIIALVDEATGFQAVRRHDALMKVLEAFVAKELQKWTLTFDPEFYEELFRLRGLTYTGAAAKPGFIGHLTNDLIYARLAPALLEDLQRKNPPDPESGRRKRKHHQWLTRAHGHPALQKRIEGVTVLMQFSRNWHEFYWRLEERYPRFNETPLLNGMCPDFGDDAFSSRSA